MKDFLSFFFFQGPEIFSLYNPGVFQEFLEQCESCNKDRVTKVTHFYSEVCSSFNQVLNGPHFVVLDSFKLYLKQSLEKIPLTLS